MDSRRILLALVLTLLAASEPGAQNRVRTETIIPPANLAPPADSTAPSATAPAPAPGAPATPLPPVPLPPIGSAAKPYGRTGTRAGQKIAEVLTDVSRLPAPVARMRARIIEAARTGDLDKLVTVMQTNETMPIFSFANERDPAAYWRANYPESGGLEVLSILLEILHLGFVAVDAGTPQDMY